VTRAGRIPLFVGQLCDLGAVWQRELAKSVEASCTDSHVTLPADGSPDIRVAQAWAANWTAACPGYYRKWRDPPRPMVRCRSGSRAI